MKSSENTIMLHGADLLSYKKENQNLIDFSSNINPLGYPRGLKDYIYNNFDRVLAYPDIKYRSLKDNLSKFLKADKENIIVGNGSVELIDLIISFFDSLVIPFPAFMEYEYRANKRNKSIIHVEGLGPEMKTDFKKINEIFDENENCLLILGNPCNPIGYVLSYDEISSLYKKAQDTNNYILLDEAFSDYIDKSYDSISLFKGDDYSNIFILRAATKFFSLPGIRLGYGVCSKKWTEKIDYISNPWSVNSFADIAAEFIFNDQAYMDKSRSYFKKELSFLRNELTLIDEILFYDSCAPYILIKLLKEDNNKIFNFLLDRNILIRKCDNIRGLSNKFVRIAVKDYNLNRILINHLKEYFNGK